MASLVLVRNQTRFVVTPKFEKMIKKFGPSVAVEIVRDIRRFELQWKQSESDDDLSPRFNFKLYKGVNQPYKLYQIYLGLTRPHPSYRAVIMFYNGFLKACWIHAFKKEGDSEPQEVELAMTRAHDYWNSLEKEERQ